MTPQQFKEDVKELWEKGFSKPQIVYILSDRYDTIVYLSTVSMIISRNKYKKGKIKDKYIR